MTGPSKTRYALITAMISAALLLPAVSFSQEKLTLEGAVDTGLQNSPALEVSQYDTEAAKARLNYARSGLYPQVTLSETYSQTNSPLWAFGTKLNQGEITMQDFNPDVLNDPDEIENWNTKLAVTLPVFNKGQTWIGVAQATENREAKQHAEERARQEVIYNVTEAYANILFAKEQYEVLSQAIETARAHMDMVESMYDSGMAVKSDLLRARVRVAELEQQLLEVKSHIELAKAGLNAAMGVDPDSEYELTGSLDNTEPMTRELDQWIEIALTNRPDLLAVRKMEKMADKEVDKSKTRYLPAVYLQGSWESNTEDFEDTKENYTVGAMATMDLFNGFGNYSQLEEAEANRAKAMSMRRQFELGVGVQVRQAYFRTESARQRIQVAKQSVSEAEEGMRIVRDRYRTGLYTIVNLLDAETALQKARTNYVTSLYQYKVARAGLELAAGTLGTE